MAAGNLAVPGAVAQLVERLRGTQEVAGSTPVSSTQLLPALLATWDAIGFTLGGLVAAEGSFFGTRKQPPFADGTPRKHFVFQIAMANRDRPLLEALRMFLGFGSIHDVARRRSHWEPQSVLTIASRKAHHAATIPFAERYLLRCAKRNQFEAWRDALLQYELDRPTRYGKGPSPCSIPGCGKPVRGRGLCRSHYYRATGY
jgi:LAGLIDADG endonuclease